MNQSVLKDMGYGSEYEGSFGSSRGGSSCALIIVLFILFIIVLASFVCLNKSSPILSSTGRCNTWKNLDTNIKKKTLLLLS